MAYPYTEDGYNMYDMLSMLQKAIRRCDYENAGFAAYQLRNSYRSTMWNRLLVISAEDCFGVLTKELIALKKQDDRFKLYKKDANDLSKTDQIISNAVALMCRSKKSRDACYFACNFVLASRNPRVITPPDEFCNELYRRTKGKDEGKGKDMEYDQSGFVQMSFFLEEPESDFHSSIPESEMEIAKTGAALQIALKHRDMDMIGYEMDALRHKHRDFLWDVLIDYAKNTVRFSAEIEIEALREADNIVNRKKKDKDEIFISKAAILLCHYTDSRFETVLSSEVVKHISCIDWPSIKVKPMETCKLQNGKIPEWVYDCHTLKGKRMGKTDWDMTTTEQSALFPLQPAYFDEASWIYTYEQDYENGDATSEQMIPIREYAKKHPANPVKYIPYE